MERKLKINFKNRGKLWHNHNTVPRLSYSPSSEAVLGEKKREHNYKIKETANMFTAAGYAIPTCNMQSTKKRGPQTLQESFLLSNSFSSDYK